MNCPGCEFEDVHSEIRSQSPKINQTNQNTINQAIKPVIKHPNHPINQPKVTTTTVHAHRTEGQMKFVSMRNFFIFKKKSTMNRMLFVRAFPFFVYRLLFHPSPVGGPLFSAANLSSSFLLSLVCGAPCPLSPPPSSPPLPSCTLVCNTLLCWEPLLLFLLLSPFLFSSSGLELFLCSCLSPSLSVSVCLRLLRCCLLFSLSVFAVQLRRSLLLLCQGMRG